MYLVHFFFFFFSMLMKDVTSLPVTQCTSSMYVFGDVGWMLVKLSDEEQFFGCSGCQTRSSGLSGVFEVVLGSSMEKVTILFNSYSFSLRHNEKVSYVFWLFGYFVLNFVFSPFVLHLVLMSFVNNWGGIP